MSADVRIEIEHDERMPAAMEHEVLLIVIGFAPDPAEDTLTTL
jgi:hypothetical protein